MIVTINIVDLFRLFSLSSEFKQIPIREEEKKEIEKLMLKVPIPIKGAFDEPASKINILLQAYISEFKLDGYAIASDMVYIAQSAGRIMRALFEICLKRTWANSALTCLNVCKMIDKRMWSTMTPLRQFKVIPEEILHKVERKEQLTWDRFFDLTATQISELVKINKKQGEGVHKLVHTFPRLELMANIQPLTRSSILVEIIITPDFKWNNSYHGSSETFHVIVEDNDSEIILHYELFILKAKYSEEDHRLAFIVPMIEPVPPQYFIRVVSDRWINCEKLLAISFKHTILPEKFPPNTKLLDLQPLLFSLLKFPEAERMYKEIFKFTQLFPIQTQSFKTIYESNESVFIGAPTGSGKTLCADFAILKYLKDLSSSQSKNRAPIIYVAANQSIVKNKYTEYSHKFGDILGYKVEMLSGQLSLDNKIFDNSHIVFGTPDNLDMLTRRWRKKQSIQDISLVIADELHLIGEAGSVLEIVLSRLRYISNQVEKEMRIIALSTSLANPYSIADWLGIKHVNVYNFNPNVRPNKLEIFIQGYDHCSRKMRLMAMSKPLYTAIKAHSNKQSEKLPCMIYVSDRKQARVTALDLLTNAASDDYPKRFLTADFTDEFNDLLEEIDEPTLKHTLRFGIGYLYESLSDREKEIIIDLYKSNIIQVLIITHSMCWEVNAFCYVAVVLDPMKYNGKENSWIDYSVPDMLQIMGRASLTNNNSNSTCKFILFCQSSKKEFYKKFLSESFPLESHLNHFLHDHINAEIVAYTIQNKQDCLDWLTWTYLYRRLLQNPNYYDLKGKTNVHLNDYLSELVENTLIDLNKANCLLINEKTQEISPLNYGRIAVFYYVKYNTIDLFAQSLKEDSKKMRDMLEILKSAYEFENIQIRKGDEILLSELSEDLVYKLNKNENLHFNEPHIKSYILLQTYFSRKPIPSDIVPDQKEIVELAQRLVLAMVDVLSTRGLLKHALLAMELCQMIIQSMWISQSPLFQLPYFDHEMIKRCTDRKIEDICDLMNMDDDERKDLLKLNDNQIMEVAKVCNRYPVIEMKVTLIQKNIELIEEQSLNRLEPKENFEVFITLNRDWDSNSLPPVLSLYYPSEKEEAWWLIVGESLSNSLLSIKRFNFVKEFKLSFKLTAPETEGKYAYKFFLISDSWVGCDQEEKIEFNVS
jgi:pre-mRNA-splicing helicase BRR2